MEKWDLLNKEHFVSGIGGVDAHTRRLGKGYLSMLVFPLKVELKGIRTHLYLKAPLDHDCFDNAQQSIIESLRDGYGFISNFRRGDARGTKLSIEYSDGSRAFPGKAAKTPLPAQITVELPEKGDIFLIANGNRGKSISAKKASFPIAKEGIYRIEVYRKSKAWIYSNPFPVGAYPVS